MPRVSDPASSTPLSRRRALQALFAEYNVRYFGGRLPRYRISLARRHDRAGLGTRHGGECFPRTKIIFVAPGMPEETQRRVLLHEMCHIGCLYHGQRWQAKMRRLAELGEPWAAEQAEEYRRLGRSSSNAELRWRITDGASLTPNLPWIKARRIFAEEWLLRPLRFEKRFPWAKAAWRRECAEWRADEACRAAFFGEQARDTERRA